MISMKQIYKHNPPETIGDCWRTCFACLLEIPVTDVPHFCETSWEDNPESQRKAKEWLKTKGYSYFEYPIDCDFETLQIYLDHYLHGIYCMIGGTSKNGTGHSVIMLNGAIVWDPSLDDSGILGPMSDGYYWITVLIPGICIA